MILNSEDNAVNPKDMTVPKPAEAAESELEKSNFLARMSHEMRTPLNAILGMCSIAQSTDEPEKIASCIAKINEASMHLLGIINDILDIAKIETGKLKLVNDKFHLAQFLKKTIGMIKFTLDAKKQNLILDFDPALPETVICDEQKLAQVLLNLLSNAVKFTPPEGVITMSVKKLKEEGSDCTLGIKVSDTGIGISPLNLKKIFAPFEQLDGNLDRKFGGAGIGLTISRSIIQLMGGDIKVESSPGKGSCFAFEINLESVETEPAIDSSSRKLSLDVKPGKHKYKDLTILLVEDVEINREIVLSLLEDTGLPIDCAENGTEAMELFRANPAKYGLILMDIHMPEMDGLEATRQIRAFEEDLKRKNVQLPGRAQRVPIIAMTANVFRDDIDNCIAAGMTGHLGKPVEIEDLLEQLDKYLT